LQVVHLPNLAQFRLNELTSLFYNFIWNNKPDRVKRNTLIGDITQGGLNMIQMSLTEESVCGFASLRQSKTSLQKGFFKLTEISLSFSFCRYKTLSPPCCLRSVEKLVTNNFLMFYRSIARIPKAFKDCLKENLLYIHFDTR
jgi:hypothetical protein